MILYLMRHGQTNWNKTGRLQGRTDIPLNDNGRLVAEMTREGLKDVPFDVAFTSPLIRAKETAEIILRGRNVPIIEDERIIEVGFGIYEGAEKNKADENIEKFFMQPEKYVPMGNGESLENVLEREKAFLEELFHNNKYENSTVLISTHGAALSGLLCIIKGWPIEDWWKGGLHANCGLSIIEVQDKIPRILKEATVMYGQVDDKQDK